MRSLSLMALLHFLTNAILLSIGYYWLGVPESRAATLAWSVCLAIVFLAGACGAYGAALAYFREVSERKAWKAWRVSGRNMAPMAVAVIAVGSICLTVANGSAWSARMVTRIASILHLRIKTSTATATGRGIVWLLLWVVLPVLLLPMLAAISDSGWRGFRAIGSKSRKWLFWIEAPVLLLLAVRLPMFLLSWIPRVRGFRMEAFSFGVRAGLAYLLFGAGWLTLAFVTSGGRPRLTQPNTAVPP
jgi:hypothetical protein